MIVFLLRASSLTLYPSHTIPFHQPKPLSSGALNTLPSLEGEEEGEGEGEGEEAFELVENPSLSLIRGMRRDLVAADVSAALGGPDTDTDTDTDIYTQHGQSQSQGQGQGQGQGKGRGQGRGQGQGQSSLSLATLRSRLRPYWSLPIPKLRVLIMTVGTRYDRWACMLGMYARHVC
jgi:hypothetical protein